MLKPSSERIRRIKKSFVRIKRDRIINTKVTGGLEMLLLVEIRNRW